MIGVPQACGGASLGNKLKLETGFPKSAIIADSQLSRFGMKQRGASDTEPTAEQPQLRKKSSRKRFGRSCKSGLTINGNRAGRSAGYFNGETALSWRPLPDRIQCARRRPVAENFHLRQRRRTRQRRAAMCAADHYNRQRLLGQPRYAGGYQAIFRKRHQDRLDASRVGGIFQP